MTRFNLYVKIPRVKNNTTANTCVKVKKLLLELFRSSVSYHLLTSTSTFRNLN